MKSRREYADRHAEPRLSRQVGDGGVLLVGHPRSGTTFLHRFMLANLDGIAGTTLEDLVFMGMGPRRRKAMVFASRGLPLRWVYRPEIHLTGMQEWETDDIAFSIHCRAGYLFWLYRQCRRRRSFRSDDFVDWVRSRQEPVLDCWDQLYASRLGLDDGPVFLSKSFIMIFYLEAFLRKYPDCRVIILSRSPLEVVPSVLSLLTSVHRRLLRFRSLPDQAIQNVLHSVGMYYEQLGSVLQDEAIARRCLHVKYSEIESGFEAVCERISDFIPSGEWREGAVAAGSKVQVSRRSRHRYELSDFGLSEADILDAVPHESI